MSKRIRCCFVALCMVFCICMLCVSILMVSADTTVTYVTGADMIANPGACQPELGISTEASGVVVVKDGIIDANDGKFAYDADVEGIDWDIKFTKATNKQIFFVLRATAAGSPWGGGHGYYALVDNMTIQVYKVDGVGAWNDEPIFAAAQTSLTDDLFDGSVYNLKFSVKESDDGFCEVSFTLNGKTITAKETTSPLSLENTYVYTMDNAAGSIDYEVYSDYTPPTEVVYTTVDDMIFAGKLYDGHGNTANKVSALLDTVSSAAGKLVYEKAVEAVDIDIKITSGDSMFFVLRASSDTAIWDGGLGYFFMVNKSGDGITVKLIKGIKEGANGDFQELIAANSTINIFSGEKINMRMAAVDAGTKVQVSFEINGEKIIDFTDSDSPLSLEGSHFAILPGQSVPSYKLYGEDGVDIVIPENAYSVYTSKTLFKATSLWKSSGAILTPGQSIASTTDQAQVIFNKMLSNAMFNFDLDIDDLSGKWLAIYLNTNKMDALWNAGFRSNVIRLEGNVLQIEYWAPQKAIASVPVTDVNLTDKINFECGMYTVKAENGEDYTFIRVAINGKEYFNQPVLDGVYNADGYFGLYNYACSYVITATDNEVDALPSMTDGTEESRMDESGMTKSISVEDWAVIANSFSPEYSYENDEMSVGGNGDVTYANAVNFSKLSFRFRMDSNAEEKGQYMQFFFGRKRQDSFIGMRLEADYTNYGYGLRILPSGSLEVIKTNTGDGYSTLMTFDRGADTGIAFGDGEYHKITVYREKVEQGLKITIFIDNDESGYSVIDKDYYEANYPMAGYISFSNSKRGTSAIIRDIVFEGEEVVPETPLNADALNFLTYYPNGNVGYIYFVVDGASYTTKWVEVYGADARGEYTVLLQRVFFPERHADIPATYQGESVLVVAVGFTEEGNWSKELRLRDTESDYTVDKQERIAIQSDENGAYFIYSESKKEFTPVGGNYMGLRGGDHSTFDAATSFTEADYDPIKTDAMMRELKANGGNVLRVFLIGRSSTNPGISGDSSMPITDETYYYEGLYVPYMENVVDFLRTAKKYGIYVMMALGDAEVPTNSYYMTLQGGAALGRNDMYLTSNGVNARTTYAKNVVTYFKEKAPDVMSAIFSIEFQNEFAVYADQAPFNRKSGTATLANGKTYDMADADSRQLAFEESVIYYLNAMTKAVKDVDPDLLVNEGSFTLNIVGNMGVYGMQNITSGDMRIPATLDVYLASDIDFLDLHIYFKASGNNTIMSSFADDLEGMNYYEAETQMLLKQKPIFMGEFGPSTRYAPNWDEPNGDLPGAREFLTETVRLAREANFKGFAVWTLESHLQKEWWNLLAADGTLDTFRDLVRIMHGVDFITGVSADDVGGITGENSSITVKGILSTDKVYYRTNNGEWSLENPVFTVAGEYVVEYKVVREFVDDYIGSAKITVLGKIEGVSVEDISVNLGDAVNIQLIGLAEGDKVFYRIGEGEWSETVPSFNTAGTFKVEYKVVRSGCTDLTGDFNVIITEKGGCKSSVDTGSIMLAGLLVAFAAVCVIKYKKIA